MSYNVVSYKNTNIPADVYVTVTNILHDAFEERLQQGLDFKCGRFTPEDLKSDLSGQSYLFIAMDENDCPVGTVSLKIRCKMGFVYGGYENLAVISDYKGKSVAAVLTDELIRKSKELNLMFITSSTACNAHSSVRFHQKKGFRIYMRSFGKKYNSYNFILPLKKLKLLKIELLRKVIYVIMTSIAYLKNKNKV